MSKTKLSGHIGETFLWIEPGEPKEHLRVIVSAPNADGEFVAVSVSDAYFRCDQTVLIDQNRTTHPFITKPSCIVYQFAKVYRLEEVNHELGTCREKKAFSEQFSAKLNYKIQRGVLASEDTPEDVQEFFKKHGPDLPPQSDTL